MEHLFFICFGGGQRKKTQEGGKLVPGGHVCLMFRGASGIKTRVALTNYQRIAVNMADVGGATLNSEAPRRRRALMGGGGESV